MASNATQCGLFAYEIFIRIASELGIKHNLFQTLLDLHESIISSFSNSSVIKYVWITFKTYIYTHNDYSAQVLYPLLLANKINHGEALLSLRHIGSSSSNIGF